jgi:hypothetical protein
MDRFVERMKVTKKQRTNSSHAFPIYRNMLYHHPVEYFLKKKLDVATRCLGTG